MTEKQPSLSKPHDASLAWINSYSPYIRALLLLVTGASASAVTGNPLLAGILTGAVEGAVELMSSGIDQMRRERDRAFFDELEKDQHFITQELIGREDFLHAFFVSLSAARRTRNRNKIKRFARLLLTATQDYRLESDEFDEFISILEDLSPRELEILLVLGRFEDLNPRQLIEVKGYPQPENDFQRAKHFWSSFQKEIENEYRVHIDMLPSILTRLARTGLYEPINGTFYGYRGGMGHLTPAFAEFTCWIKIESDKD